MFPRIEPEQPAFQDLRAGRLCRLVHFISCLLKTPSSNVGGVLQVLREVEQRERKVFAGLSVAARVVPLPAYTRATQRAAVGSWPRAAGGRTRMPPSGDGRPRTGRRTRSIGTRATGATGASGLARGPTGRRIWIDPPCAMTTRSGAYAWRAHPRKNADLVFGCSRDSFRTQISSLADRRDRPPVPARAGRGLGADGTDAPRSCLFADWVWDIDVLRA